MEIAQTDVPEFAALLEQAKTDGHNWVVLDNAPEAVYQQSQLLFFPSVEDAENFCDIDTYHQWDAYDPAVKEPSYHYMPIDNMLYALGANDAGNDLQKLQLPVFTELLKEQSVETLSDNPAEDLPALFQREELFPVVWKKQIIPEEEVVAFHIVQHRHDGGIIYEKGHSQRILESFSSYEEAKQYMEHSVRLFAAMQENHDHILVGQFRDKLLKLDFEGYPEHNCGLVLISAYYQYDVAKKQKDYTWYAPHAFDKPHELQQYLFARYDKSEQQLKLYDDRLQPANPRDCTISIRPNYFINSNSITIQNLQIMNTENLDYLKEALRYAGFNDKLNGELEQNITANHPDFKLQHSVKMPNNDEMNYVLDFKKGDKNDMYFYNRLEATIKKPGENEAGLTQSFYSNQNITANEAYHLLEGRAVEKTYHKHVKDEEGKYQRTDQTYSTWLQTNFNQKDQYGNYELNKHGEYDIKKVAKEAGFTEMQDMDKADRFILSLKKGNLTEGTIVRNGAEEKVSVAANPEFRNLKVYDKEMNRLDLDDLKINKKLQEKLGNDQPAENLKQGRGKKI